jgi:2-polyprenyl-3-methyl-5-hydroxy-6-metoxy-1,4-benzoquinol methylase
MDLNDPTVLSFYINAIWWRIIRNDCSCPYCLSNEARRIDAKQFIELWECTQCHLRFRYPKQTDDRQGYYSGQYNHERTTLPTNENLATFRQNGFGGTPYDSTDRVHIAQLLALAASSNRVLDYGCSWGFRTWQLAQAGLDALGFDISTTHTDFGRKTLGLNLMSSKEELSRFRYSVGVFFSVFVLEHLPTPRYAFNLIDDLLGPGGYTAIFVPNGSPNIVQLVGQAKYRSFWHRNHPLLYTYEFFIMNLRRWGMTASVIAMKAKLTLWRRKIWNDS